ncbi:MAG TPA: tetratricopeptide repeat protein [Planctomycetes bacterium]|nr:tetratricopeptide repeat protein [Planctomycetota bacterium]
MGYAAPQRPQIPTLPMQPLRRPRRLLAGSFFLLSTALLFPSCGADDAPSASSPDEPGAARTQAPRSQVNPAEAALKKGAALAEANDIEGAAEAYREAVRLDPSSAKAHLALGRTLMALSRVSAGRGGDAVGADGGVDLGQDEEKLAEAVSELKRASELAPEDPDTLYWAGRALHVANQGNDAIAVLTRAVELDPAHGPAWKRIGLVHLENGDVEAARDAFEKAEPLLPEDPGIAFQLGNVLAEEDPAAARDAYRRSVETDPTFSPAYNGLAGVLGRLGDVEGAAEARANSKRWRAFLDRTRAVAAKANRNPNDKGIQIKAGELYLAHHAWTQALEYFDRALSLDASDPQVHLYCGIASRERGDLERARQHLEEALYLAPTALEVRMELISALVAQKDQARLRELLDETGAAVSSMDAETRISYGQHLAELGLDEDASVQFQGVLDTDPDDEAARAALEALASHGENG